MKTKVMTVTFAFFVAAFSAPALSLDSLSNHMSEEDKEKFLKEEKKTDSDSGTEKAGPMNFVVGETTFSEFADHFEDKSKLTLIPSKNNITGGKTVLVNPSEIDIDHTQMASFVFGRDASETLEASIIAIKKDQYETVKNHLKSNYKMTRDIKNDYGNKFTEFRTDNAVIKIQDLKSEESMELRYMTIDFKRKYNSYNQSKYKEESNNY